MRAERVVELGSEDRAMLQRQARGRSLPVRLVERSRIVMRAADGLRSDEIAAEFGITPEKAARSRNRFLDGGLDALRKEVPRPGRTRTIGDRAVARVVEMTTQDKPGNATHWSTRTMVEATGLSAASVFAAYGGLTG